ncbi:MAG: corrinoid protein [Clostridia bacterium]|nr:corrinoid protein [Clostridia bacterium]
MRNYSELNKMVETGKAKIVKQLVEAAIADGADPKEILEQGLLPGMSVIGEKFKNNEVYVPEVLVAARAMNAGTTLLKPLLISSDIQAPGTAVIGTVKGDLHDIGKNLVKMMLEGKGIHVIDLGVDVSAEQFVNAAIENEAQIICCSALLTTTMSEMEAVVNEASAKGIREKVFIMVGGAPITQEFCDKIGADCYTSDAAAASDAAIAHLKR